MNAITRERFLKLLLAGGSSFLGLSSLSAAVSPLKGPLLPWSRLKFVGEEGDTSDWHVHPQGDLNLIDSIRDQTSVNLEKKWNVADVADLQTMTPYPFLFMHGEIAPVLDANARKNLREYWLRGGFVFAEDCVMGYMHHGRNETNDFFFRSVVEDFPSILPGSKLERVPNDHPVFHCFYHLPGMPHMQGTPHGLHALTYDGRTVALISPSDLHCAWTDGDVWFGPEKRIEAMKMGTNLYLYAMTQAAG